MLPCGVWPVRDQPGFSWRPERAAPGHGTAYEGILPSEHLTSGAGLCREIGLGFAQGDSPGTTSGYFRWCVQPASSSNFSSITPVARTAAIWHSCIAALPTHELVMAGRTDHFGYSLLEGSFISFPSEIYILSASYWTEVSIGRWEVCKPRGYNRGHLPFFVLQEPSAPCAVKESDDVAGVCCLGICGWCNLGALWTPMLLILHSFARKLSKPRMGVSAHGWARRERRPHALRRWIGMWKGHTYQLLRPLVWKIKPSGHHLTA